MKSSQKMEQGNATGHPSVLHSPQSPTPCLDRNNSDLVEPMLDPGLCWMIPMGSNNESGGQPDGNSPPLYYICVSWFSIINIVMKTLGILAVVLMGLAATAFLLRGGQTTRQFETYKARFGKVYTPEEEQFRKAIFNKNLHKIEEHNADSSNTYEMGVNQFSDMTTEEFVQKHLMKELPPITDAARVTINDPILQGQDWRTSGSVSGVKNQGSCGSCWSFSTTGVLESTYKIRKGSMVLLSEQQLVDCCGSKGYQCQGCNGAWPEWALNYVRDVGIVTQASYPYTGRVGNCNVNSGNKILSSNAYRIINAGDTNSVKSAVGSAPVSICVDASNWSPYKSGVFSNCGKNLNHAVLLIGYEDSGTWIVKNSWGTGWGENGYIRLAAGNTCGIADHAITVNIA